jgi:hypothetical protein
MSTPASQQRSRTDGWFEVIAGKAIPADGRPACFGYVQTYDAKPKRRLFEVLKAQGMAANQQVTFLTDGGEDIRDLPCYLNAQADHLLDWFHLTMRITVMANMAKSLQPPRPGTPIATAKGKVRRQALTWAYNGSARRCCLLVVLVQHAHHGGRRRMLASSPSGSSRACPRSQWLLVTEVRAGRPSANAAVPANCPGVRPRPAGVHLHRHTSPALRRDPPLPADRVRHPGEGGPGRDAPTRGSSGKIKNLAACHR